MRDKSGERGRPPSVESELVRHRAFEGSGRFLPSAPAAVSILDRAPAPRQRHHLGQSYGRGAQHTAETGRKAQNKRNHPQGIRTPVKG